MVDIERLWQEVSKLFPILNGNVYNTEIDDEQLQKVYEDLASLDLGDFFCDMLWSELHSVIREEIVPQFWAHFPIRADVPDNDLDYRFQVFHGFCSAVENLQESFNSIESIINHTQFCSSKNIKSRNLRGQLLETLLGQIPTGFNEALYAFYHVSFQIYTHLYTKQSSMISDPDAMIKKLECCACNSKMNLCECQSLDIIINKTNKALKEMELLDGIAGQSLTALVQKCIHDHIKETCHGIFDRSFLRQLECESIAYYRTHKLPKFHSSTMNSS